MSDEQSPAAAAGAGERKNPVLGLAALLATAAAAKKATEEGSAGGAGGSEEEAALDFRRKDAHKQHPFFSYYGSAVHQQNMMQDSVRTTAYFNAITGNPSDFAGKTVMDIGTGSGILAYFAARAGARRVWAVEASDMAERAEKLMNANGYGSVVKVIKGKVEEIEVPADPEADAADSADGAEGKVDVLISEPMGFMLIHERMLESYIIARQRFLKPGGKMFPSQGTIFTAPFTDASLWQEQINKVAFWHSSDFYGLDLNPLAEEAAADHFAQPIVGYISPESLMATTTSSLLIDFLNDSPESLHSLELPFSFEINKTGICHGLAAWFTVLFDGTDARTVLSTGPHDAGTHWYSCRLLLKDPIAVNAKQRVKGTLVMKANTRYSYNCTLTMELDGSGATTVDGSGVASVAMVRLQDQLYHYMQSSPSS